MKVNSHESKNAESPQLVRIVKSVSSKAKRVSKDFSDAKNEDNKDFFLRTVKKK